MTGPMVEFMSNVFTIMILTLLLSIMILSVRARSKISSNLVKFEDE